MNTGKMFELLISGSEVVAAVRKMNRVVNAVRAIAYVSLAAVVLVNVAGALKLGRQ